MRFSIRAIFALTFLVALVLLAWRTQQGAQRDKARLERLNDEIVLTEARLRLGRPVLYQANLNMQDGFKSLHAMRDRAIAHYDVVSQKYTTIEARGSDVLSIRGIPSLQVGAESAPIIYRLLVPAESSKWLKFGFYLVDR